MVIHQLSNYVMKCSHCFGWRGYTHQKLRISLCCFVCNSLAWHDLRSCATCDKTQLLDVGIFRKKPSHWNHQCSIDLFIDFNDMFVAWVFPLVASKFEAKGCKTIACLKWLFTMPWCHMHCRTLGRTRMVWRIWGSPLRAMCRWGSSGWAHNISDVVPGMIQSYPGQLGEWLHSLKLACHVKMEPWKNRFKKHDI